MGDMLQQALKRPMHRKCTCVRCKAKDFVLSVHPSLDDMQALAVAEKIVKALHSSIIGSRRHVAQEGAVPHD